MKNFTISFCLLTTLFTFAQSKESLKHVVQATDLESLKDLSIVLKSEYAERQNRINHYLSKNPHIKKRVVDGQGVNEIYDVVNDSEIYYYTTSNAGSARTSRTNRLYGTAANSLNINIQGQGMKAYVWDGGNVKSTHVELQGKIVLADGNDLSSAHPTHVMGTIIAKGIDAAAKGIAFDATGVSYDWDNDYDEMISAVEEGMLISNHSYWIGSSNSSSEWIFGAYDNRARNFDNIAYNAPFYLAVTAAGNDRNENRTQAPYRWIKDYNDLKGGYNLIRGMQNAKNYLTVGAVEGVTVYRDPSDVVMSSFSNWGPTDDGRIKPEVVTKGVAVYSTSTRVTPVVYESMQGTSMASPGVAGNALLLQQYYNVKNNRFMRAATLKGLLIHTADECGDAPGPDYSFGYGLINAEKAVNLITDKSIGKSIIDELHLNNGGSYSRTVNVQAGKPLVVSISWTDIAASTSITNIGTEDPANVKYLVNDLDVRVTRNGITYYPWTLNPAINSEWLPAVRNADNNRDNYEKIEIDAPVTGTYTITVTHKGNLLTRYINDAGTRINQAQGFTLIASGNQMTLSDDDFKYDEKKITVFPNPASDILNYSVGGGLEVQNITLTDITGKEIISSLNNIGSDAINVAHLQSGVYFVKFATDKNVIVKKFIKK